MKWRSTVLWISLSRLCAGGPCKTYFSLGVTGQSFKATPWVGKIGGLGARGPFLPCPSVKGPNAQPLTLAGNSSLCPPPNPPWSHIISSPIQPFATGLNISRNSNSAATLIQVTTISGRGHCHSLWTSPHPHHPSCCLPTSHSPSIQCGLLKTPSNLVTSLSNPLTVPIFFHIKTQIQKRQKSSSRMGSPHTPILHTLPLAFSAGPSVPGALASLPVPEFFPGFFPQPAMPLQISAQSWLPYRSLFPDLQSR